MTLLIIYININIYTLYVLPSLKTGCYTGQVYFRDVEVTVLLISCPDGREFKLNSK